jgi:hypothetical protein
VLRVRLLHAGLREVRVQPDLVYRGYDLGGLQQLVLGHEVGDPDRPDLAVGQELFESFVGADRALERVPETRLAEINQIAASTRDDPELDTLLRLAPRPPAAAAERQPFGRPTWTRTSA